MLLGNFNHAEIVLTRNLLPFLRCFQLFSAALHVEGLYSGCIAACHLKLMRHVCAMAAELARVQRTTVNLDLLIVSVFTFGFVGESRGSR